MHFVSEDPKGARLLAEFVAASGLEIYELCRPPELDAAVALMEKYADTPMDFADATLVLLAEALDRVAAESFDVKTAAGQLGCSTSQLVKLLKIEPQALAVVNRGREGLGLERLH